MIWEKVVLVTKISPPAAVNVDSTGVPGYVRADFTLLPVKQQVLILRNDVQAKEICLVSRQQSNVVLEGREFTKASFKSRDLRVRFTLCWITSNCISVHTLIKT